MLRLELTTWQRIMAVQALNAQAGHISLIRKALRLLEILELSAEERGREAERAAGRGLHLAGHRAAIRAEIGTANWPRT